MRSYIPITFLFMAVAFYELSGGDTFEPEAPKAVFAQVTPVATAPQNDTVAQRSTPEATPAIETTARASTVPSLDMRGLAALTASDPGALGPRQVAQVSFVPETAAAPPPAAATEVAVTRDLREVTAARVNVRSGPGTGHGVVAQMVLGETAEVIQDPGAGWVEVIGENGQVGWMADYLLAAR